MKKLVLTFVAILSVSFIFAQEIAIEENTSTPSLVSKKGVPILPESGEFSIGIDAMVFFNYMGNMFNGNVGNTSPGFNFTANQPLRITAKYMMDDETALRLIFRLGLNSTTDKETVALSGATIVTQTVEDKYKYSTTDIGIGAGLEKRRGKGRLQGVYGGQAIIGLTSKKHAFEYGNSINAVNTTPNRSAYNYFNDASATTVSNVNGGVYTVEDAQKLAFGLNLQGFVGVEYFFAPKISISGEFTYGLYFQGASKSEITTEWWNGTAVESLTVEAAGDSRLGLDTGIGAFLNLNFYF